MVSSAADWIPITVDPEVDGTEAYESVVMTIGRRRPMTASSHNIPRLLSSAVGAGSTLVAGDIDGSKITMYCGLYTGLDQLEEDEVEDSTPDALAAYGVEWRNQLMLSIDNAAFGVTGDRSATETDKRPYNSVYQVVTNNDSEANYTANTNYDSGALTYAKASATLGLVESSRYGNPASMVWVAHPGLRKSLREILDDVDRPIFQDASGNILTDRLFGFPVHWSHGAISSTDFDMGTTNGKLLIAMNKRYLVTGPRVAPQSRLIPASANTGALVHSLQHRCRHGAAFTVPQAASVFEVTA